VKTSLCQANTVQFLVRVFDVHLSQDEGVRMNRVRVKSKVGNDGVLQVSLPLGSSEAGQEVQITIEPVNRSSLSADEWRHFVMETAGKWQGELERPEQGEYEQRELLS
jgi:hypothetical protein